MRCRVVRSSLLALLVALAAAPAAGAAPVPYTLSLDNAGKSSITLDGDQVTALAVQLSMNGCTSSGSFGAQATLAAPVAFSGGAVHVETDAPLTGYTDSSVHVTLDGTLSVDRATLQGTITESGLHSPFDTGCPAVVHPFFAIPTPALVPPDPEHEFTFAGPNSKGDATSGHITRLIATVPAVCGSSTQVHVVFDTRAYGITDIPVSPSGAWSLTRYVLDDYEIVRLLTITGQVTGGNVSGRYQVASPPGVGGSVFSGCIGDATLSATATGATVQPPIGGGTQPTTPGTLGSSTGSSIGPSATFQWASLRRDRSNGSRFYFLAAHVHCQRGATHVRITIDGGRTHTVRCGASLAYASGPLDPGRGYFARAVAVKLRRHRVVAHGRAVGTSLQMPAANAAWQPIGRVPGRPPTI